MKNLFLFFGVFVPSVYFSQIKLNTGNDIDIFLMDSSISMEKYLNPKIPYQYKIVNHTNNYYLIDPQGFLGEAVLYEGNKLYSNPEKLIPQSYYSRDEEDCEQDFIVLKKHETIQVELYLLNIKYYYNLKPNKRYYLDVKSKHNKYTATLLGCNNYINNLEKKGYKILYDRISFKIPLTK